MTTTPNAPGPDDENADPSDQGSPSTSEGNPGAEIGISEDEGSSFEPEEDRAP